VFIFIAWALHSVFFVVTKSSGKCLRSILRNVIGNYCFRVLSIRKSCWSSFATLREWISGAEYLEIVIRMGSVYYVLTSFFPFLFGVQVDTIKLHYFRNLYIHLNLFEVRDRGFDFL
jgi:hypothetical protein